MELGDYNTILVVTAMPTKSTIGKSYIPKAWYSNMAFREKESIADLENKLKRLTAHSTVRLIIGELRKELKDDEKVRERLINVVNFVENHEERISYFHTIAKTGAVDILTSERVIKFLQDIGHSSGYFFAIQATGEIDALTSDRVIKFAESIGQNLANDYFYLIGTGRGVDTLTSERVIRFAKSIGNEVGSYLSAIRSAETIDLLTSEEVTNEAGIRTVQDLGKRASGYFHAIATGMTEAADILTSERVTKFAKSLGNSANSYFSAIIGTKEIDLLTSEEVFDFIRGLGNNATKSTFLNYIGSFNSRSEDILKLMEICNIIGGSTVLRSPEGILHQMLNSDLYHLVKDKNAFENVVTYLSSDNMLPRPDESNVKEYLKVANEYVLKTYSITRELNTKQIRMLFSIERKDRKRIAKLVNDSRENGLREYPIVESGKSEYEKYATTQLMEYCVLLLLKQDPKNEAKNILSEIVGEKIVARALNEFSAAKHNSIRKSAAILLEKEGYDKAYEYLQSRFANNEKIKDLLDAAQGRVLDVRKGKLTSVESNNPFDFNSRDLGACIFMPSGMMKESVVAYCTDKRALLIRYNIGEETAGTAVCLVNENVFFINSIEGSSEFRSKAIFGHVLKDILERARSKGFREVVFHANPSNGTPREFVNFLDEEGFSQIKISVSFGDFAGHTDVPKNRGTIPAYFVSYLMMLD